jgi:DNA-binding NarL/FixJ family response regulator
LPLTSRGASNLPLQEAIHIDDRNLNTMREIDFGEHMDNLDLPQRRSSGIRRDQAPGQAHIFIVGHRDFSVHGLASMIEASDDRFSAACVEPDEECLNRLAACPPDALLIQNESLPQPSEQFLQALIRRCPDARLLVFGKGMSDEHLYRLVLGGVHGYINERMDGEHFKRALDHLLDGKTWIERHILERFVARQQGFDDLLESRFNQRIEGLCDRLTKREVEILGEVVRGLAIKQIAERVHLSHQGVKMHLAKLFRKFNVNNRNQLILAAFDEISPVEDLSVLLRRGLSRTLQDKQSAH